MSNVTREELRTVGIFHDLPDEQLDWFLEHSTESRLQPGEIYVRAGDPADKMAVVIEGELQARFQGANENVFTTHAGMVTGLLPYSRMKVFPATGRAIQPSRILLFPAAEFDELLSHLPELGDGWWQPWWTDPRSYAGRAATRSAGCTGQTFSRAGSRVKQSRGCGAACRGAAA